MKLALLTSSRTTPSGTVGIRPTAAGDGIDVSSLLSSNVMAPQSALLTLTSTVTANGTAPAGGTMGVELWLYIGGGWRLAGGLAYAQSIPAILGAGYVETLGAVGLGTRAAIAGTVSAGVVSYTFTPIEEVS